MTAAGIKQHAEYRSKTAIIEEILLNTLNCEPEGITRLKIVYLAHVSSLQMREYIPLLVENELVTIDQSTGVPVSPSKTDSRKNKPTTRGDTIHITQKGKDYLSILKEQKGLGIKI